MTGPSDRTLGYIVHLILQLCTPLGIHPLDTGSYKQSLLAQQLHLCNLAPASCMARLQLAEVITLCPYISG